MVSHTDDPLYDEAARVAAHIINCLNHDECTAMKYGAILFFVLALIKQCEQRGWERASGISFNIN